MLNRIRAMDFMHDALYGRAIRILNVIDEANREALAIEVGTSIPAARVVRVLEQLVEMHGAPAAIRCDNGPEFTSGTFAEWCEQMKIEVRYIQPGKPDQNAYMERFNRTYRGDVLDAWLFRSAGEVQELSDDETIHDKDNTYTWLNAFASKIATLNGGGGFAGHTDWRVPNALELESIKNFAAGSPAVHSAFHASCAATCTVLTCSCATPGDYWSSTTAQSDLTKVHLVNFSDGDTFDLESKIGSPRAVRAVRAGV